MLDTNFKVYNHSEYNIDECFEGVMIVPTEHISILITEDYTITITEK